jgi:hypothetical protein
MVQYWQMARHVSIAAQPVKLARLQTSQRVPHAILQLILTVTCVSPHARIILMLIIFLMSASNASVLVRYVSL